MSGYYSTADIVKSGRLKLKFQSQFSNNLLLFSKQRDTSLQPAGINYHTTISKQILIGSSKSMKFTYQTESQQIH